jgi:hypothetical protein
MKPATLRRHPSNQMEGMRHDCVFGPLSLFFFFLRCACVYVWRLLQQSGERRREEAAYC